MHSRPGTSLLFIIAPLVLGCIIGATALPVMQNNFTAALVVRLVIGLLLIIVGIFLLFFFRLNTKG